MLNGFALNAISYFFIISETKLKLIYKIKFYLTNMIMSLGGLVFIDKRKDSRNKNEYSIVYCKYNKKDIYIQLYISRYLSIFTYIHIYIYIN